MLSTEFELVKGFPVGAVWETQGFESWVGKILWSRKWQPVPVFLPGKFHGQRSLDGYSPWAAESQTQHAQWGQRQDGARGTSQESIAVTQVRKGGGLSHVGGNGNPVNVLDSVLYSRNC